VPPPLFLSADPLLRARARAVAAALPELRGRSILLQFVPGLRDRRGPVHAAAFLRERRIAFDCSGAEFPRIFVHELFHFVWLRCGNPLRWSFEDLVAAECRSHARGELGWSAEWRKVELRWSDPGRRGRAWREYVCESFCDTAAWLYSGVNRHPEFTLPQPCRRTRRQWFERELERRGLSI
jgi:hypothetical protein